MKKKMTNKRKENTNAGTDRRNNKGEEEWNK